PLTGLVDIDFSEIKNKSWFIFAEKDNLSDEWVQRLRSLGARAICIYKGNHFKQTEDDYTVNPKETEKFKNYLNLIFKEVNQVSQVVHLWGLDQENALIDEHCISEILLEGLYALT